MVNTSQQVGGSIGTAVLSTLSASAVTAFVAGKAPTAAVAAQAAVNGYTTAFMCSAVLLGAGAVATALLLRGGAPEVGPEGEGTLAMAH